MAAREFDYRSLCKQVCDVDANVVGAWVVKEVISIASFVKPKVPLPASGELARILFQGQLMVQIPKTNEIMYGDLEMVMVRHASLDALLFPLSKNDSLILAAGCARPYNDSQVINEIVSLIRGTISSDN